MLQQLRPAVVMALIMTVLAGLIYPFLITGIAQLVFPSSANGSLIMHDGKVIGSSLIGQEFDGRGYFHSRPSYAGAGYEADNSGASNLGPTSRKLVEAVKRRVAVIRMEDGVNKVPVDLVTGSASGLDPDISPASALLQVNRVAKARRLAPATIRSLVETHIKGRTLGIVGEPRVNVLELNLALDDLAAKGRTP
jgi:potassium-transporting ATPase KdpC subunit